MSRSAIRRSRRALPTITWCPYAASRRRIHGECVPVSKATRAGAIARKRRSIAAGVVGTRPSSTISPCASSTHSTLWRSPTSRPTVVTGADASGCGEVGEVGRSMHVVRDGMAASPESSEGGNLPVLPRPSLLIPICEAAALTTSCGALVAS